MSVFDASSRYVLFAGLSTAPDRKGRSVPCVLPARIPHARARLLAPARVPMQTTTTTTMA